MQFVYLELQAGVSDAADPVSALISAYDSRGCRLGSAILKAELPPRGTTVRAAFVLVDAHGMGH